MPLEIERKFLLANDGWRSAVVRSELLRDGLICRFGGGKLRVRWTKDAARLAVKGPKVGISRYEFEYEIPPGDAEEMLRTLCHGPVLEKIRHTVPHAGFVWTVDVHLGPLAGVTLAEVELRNPEDDPPLPSWVGKEVTHNPRFQQRALLRRCAAAARVKPSPELVATAIAPS